MNAMSPPVTDRIAISRERLREAMRANTAAKEPVAGQPKASSTAVWLEFLKSFQGSRVLLDALRLWWAQHPLRGAATLAKSAVDAAVVPLAQRRPWSLVFGAFAVGVLVVWSRPWRWPLVPALVAGLVPQIFSVVAKKAQPQPLTELLSTLIQQWLKPKD